MAGCHRPAGRAGRAGVGRHRKFFTPEIAVDAFASVAAYRRNQEWLLEVPPPLPALSAPDLPAAERVRAQAIAANRSRLADTETAALLSAFGIPAAPLSVVSTVAAARAFARRIGYPVVLERDGDVRRYAPPCATEECSNGRGRSLSPTDPPGLPAAGADSSCASSSNSPCRERCASPCAPIRCSGRSSATARRRCRRASWR